MKLFRIILVILAFAQIALTHMVGPLCAKANFCQICYNGFQSCHTQGCFSWGMGSHADKAWDSTGTKCTGTMPANYKVTDCRINNDLGASIMVSTSTVSASDHPRCKQCNGKTFLTFSTIDVLEECTDTPPSSMSGCTEIVGCLQTMCDYTFGGQVKVCIGGCDVGYYPAEILTNGLYKIQQTCSKTITNEIPGC